MFSRQRLPSWNLLTLVLAVALSGCASGYHDYADCCVPYRYCRPRPLPYVSYQGCHCPTPLGSHWASSQSADSVPLGHERGAPLSPGKVSAASSDASPEILSRVSHDSRPKAASSRPDGDY